MSDELAPSFLSAFRSAHARARGGAGHASQRLLPEAKSAKERVGVVARPAACGQFFELFDVASAENHVVRLKRGDKPLDDIRDELPPFLSAIFLQPAKSHVILVRGLLDTAGGPTPSAQ